MLVGHGMLGRKDSFCLTRTIVAACLALVLSFVFFAPLAARSLIASSSSCCRNRVRCWCHKKSLQPPTGPAVSSRLCGNDCGRLTLGSIGPSGFVPPSSRSWARPTEILGRAPVCESVSAENAADYALQQRPPPAAFPA